MVQLLPINYSVGIMIPTDVTKMHKQFDEFFKIFDELNLIIQKMEHCDRENTELQKLRDWLLPILMNGQASIG